MFEFYLKIYRSGLITFCGHEVHVEFDINSNDGKFSFREYDNGRFKNKKIKSKHNNILKSVIVDKKGWGLWINTWTDGIVDWSFTKDEILNEFKIRGIKIPYSLMSEWDNLIENKKYIRNQNYINNIKKYE